MWVRFLVAQSDYNMEPCYLLNPVIPSGAGSGCFGMFYAEINLSDEQCIKLQAALIRCPLMTMGPQS